MELNEVQYQIYILPYLKITHDTVLNGNREIILGWLKWEIAWKI